MGQYLTNTIIKHKNEYINAVFFVKKGIVVENITNKTYSDNSYIFLDMIFKNEFTKNYFIAKTKVIGEWIPFTDLDNSIIKILSSALFKTSKHNELLLIRNPFIKVSRFLLYEFEITGSTSFFIPSLKNLTHYLNIPLQELSINLKILIKNNIISKHNNLINILNIKSLEEKSFLLDYI